MRNGQFSVDRRRRLRSALPGYDIEGVRTAGMRMAEVNERLRLERHKDGWHKGERGKRTVLGSAFMDNMDELNEAVRRAGLRAGHIYALGRDGMSSFVESIPLIHATLELHRQLEAAT